MATRTTPLGWDIDSFTPHKWILGKTGRHLMLHPVYGFIGAVWAIWFNRYVERINPVGNEPWDEWGHAIRQNRNSDTWSEHGGCAWDLNAALHPNGVPASQTFTAAQLTRMRRKAKRWNYYARTTVIRLGIDYKNTPDGMHSELYHKPVALKRLMRILSSSDAGKIVIAANPEHCKALRAKGYLR